MSPDQRRKALIAVAAAGLSVLLVVLFAVLLFGVVSGPDQAEVPEVALTVRAVDLAPIAIGPADYLPEDVEIPAVSDARITREPAQGAASSSRGGGVTEGASGGPTITYTPHEDFEDTDSFAFDLVDAAGEPVLSVSVTISIEITDALSASTSEVDFGEVCAWCEEATVIEIVQGDTGVQIEAIEIIDDPLHHFRVQHDCVGSLDGNCEALVAFTPDRPGASEAFLQVRHTGTGDALLVPLHGVGECERPTAERLAILDEAVGFGASATGGAEGCLVRVTSLDDEGAGTLREAAERPGPAWIVFDDSGVIELEDYIKVADDKTIDGRDAEITLEGDGLAIVDTSNVVITNLEIRDTHEDGLQIRGLETQDVWVTHVTIANVADGYIDITQGATNVTVAWSRFQASPDWPQEKTILVGAADPGDEDERSRVTLHNNHFETTEQRNPLLRSGRVHSFNNFFDGWGIYASGVSRDGQLLSERNIYAHRGGDHPDRAFTPWDEAAHDGGISANIRSVDDRFLGGASGIEANPDGVFEPEYDYEAREPDDDLSDEIAEDAGRQ